MNNQLFILKHPIEYKYAEDASLISKAYAQQYDFTQTTQCPVCGRDASRALWLQPRQVVLTSRKLPDFLHTVKSRVPYLLSERALTEIQNAGLTGIIKAEPIEHIRYLRKAKIDPPIPNYYYIEVARSKITVNHELSKIRYGTLRNEDPCPLCRQVPAVWMAAKELVFNMEAYEGYDIFHIYELGETTFVSQRFVDFCQEKKLTNFLYCPAFDWELGIF